MATVATTASLPPRERGLKQDRVDKLSGMAPSLPPRERGLKLEEQFNAKSGITSLPPRERGLKHRSVTIL